MDELSDIVEPITRTSYSAPVILTATGPFRTDRATFTVGWHDLSSHLGDTIGFRILDRLARRPNQYVPFETLILVYEVSRWGRFQDTDESAYYEYLCKRAGIQVEYCMEQFVNDGSPVSTIIKAVKRAKAGEYSRELSNKVFKGQSGLIQLGYRKGGPAGYGLRRTLLDANCSPKGELKREEHKSLQTDRVVLVPGPPEEIQTVRSICDEFVSQRYPDILSEFQKLSDSADLKPSA